MFLPYAGLGAIWLIGFLIYIPYFLKRRMLQGGCYECDLGKHTNHTYDGPIHVYQVRGEFRDRIPEDVFIAVWYAAWWPLYAAVVSIGNISITLGKAIFWLTNRFTPLTEVERDRQEALRSAEIAALTEQINS